MSDDSFSVVSSESWFGRIGNSIKGVLFGLVLVAVGCVVLFWNEGRAVKTARGLGEGGKAVVAIDAAKVDPANEKKLVHLTAMASTDEVLSDREFGISANAIKLRRSVQMYQWKESEKSETHTKPGRGSEPVKTYSTDWANDHVDSRQFQTPQGHENPAEMPVESETLVARNVKVGAFDLSSSLLDKVSNFESMPVASTAAAAGAAPTTVPTTQAAVLPASATLPPALAAKLQATKGQYYLGADPAKPVVGDVRIAFSIIRPQKVSIVSRQLGQTFEPYATQEGGTINMLKPGAFSAAAMFQAAQAENARLTWILRLAGFVAMFIGLLAIFSPIRTVADMVPLVGDLLGMGLGLAAAVIAAALSLIVIAAGWMAYRPVLGVGLLVAAVVLVVGIKKTKSGKSANPVGA